MKTNAELKAEAKEMLQGRWKEAVLINLIPTAITIVIALIFLILIAVPAYFIFNNSDMIQSFVDGSNVSTSADINFGGSGGPSLVGGLISTFFTVGISWTFLDVFRRQKMTIEPLKDAFKGFQAPYGIGILVIYLLTSIFTFLWSLLFVIPGIIKGYAYSQAYFIYYDDYRETGVAPGYLDSITKSRQLMDGHKGQLFILDLSFIGWHILCLFTLGIGYLWLTPYILTTKIAFYDNLKSA